MDDSKDNIEKFFERRLQSADFPFHEDDWKILEKRLDSELIPSGGASRTYNVIWVLVTILAFLGGWFFNDLWKASVDKTGTQSTSQSGISSSESLASEKGEGMAGDEAGTDAVNEPLKYSELPQKKYTHTEENETKSVVQASGNFAQSDTQKSSGAVRSDVRWKKLKAPLLSKKLHIPFEVPTHPLLEIPEYGEIVDANFTGKNKMQNNLNEFSLGLVVSPDLNSTGLGEEWKVSAQIGVGTYFKIGRRLLLNMNVLYADKGYTAGGYDYNPPEGYWDYFTNGAIPQEVDATCRIIDIPLNLSYLINPNAKFRVSVGTGLSSFIILNESYAYKFTDGSVSGAEGWSTKDNSAAWAGYWNLNAGIETRLMNRWDIRMEPYLRVPLKGVGYGKVDLYGSGVLFVLKRHIKFRK